ncbi:MAG: hypothetical protein IT550_13100 [Novosphingobium sp.]|nr:hypothetical protein [Novosphingobium sp.]
MARYALEGDEPLEWVGRAAWMIAEKLGRCDPHSNDPLPPREVEIAIADGQHFALLMAEIFGEAGARAFTAGKPFRPELPFVADLKRRPGKPVDRWARARLGRKFAAIVERLVADGVKQESVLEQLSNPDDHSLVSGSDRLSRSEIMKWLKSRRRWLR